MSFVRKFFGDSDSLPYTFWVIGVGGNAAIVAVDEIAYQIYGFHPYADLYLLLFFIYFFFSLQRVWESAGKYTGPAIWARLARLVMLFGAFAVLVSLVLYSLTPH